MTNILPYARAYFWSKALIATATMVAAYCLLTTPSIWPTINQFLSNWSGAILSPGCSKFWQLVTPMACSTRGIAEVPQDNDAMQNYLMVLPIVKLAVTVGLASEAAFTIPCIIALRRRKNVNRKKSTLSDWLSEAKWGAGVFLGFLIAGYVQFGTSALRHGTGVYAVYFELFDLLLYLQVSLAFLFAFVMRATARLSSVAISQ